MSRPRRPRDELGRPLPVGSDVPLEPDPQPVPPAETIATAQQLLDEGRAFRAHEVFEAAWKATADGDRDLWRGLAQLAVGITHGQRGNATGAEALLHRASATLAPWSGRRPHGVDVDGLRDWAMVAAADVAAGAPPPAPPRLIG